MFYKKAAIMVLSLVVLFIETLDKTLSALDSIPIFALLLIFIYSNIHQVKKNNLARDKEIRHIETHKTVGLNILKFAAGCRRDCRRSKAAGQQRNPDRLKSRDIGRFDRGYDCRTGHFFAGAGHNDYRVEKERTGNGYREYSGGQHTEHYLDPVHLCGNIRRGYQH